MRPAEPRTRGINRCQESLTPGYPIISQPNIKNLKLTLFFGCCQSAWGLVSWQALALKAAASIQQVAPNSLAAVSWRGWGDGRHRPDEFRHSILSIRTVSTILAPVSSFNSMYQDTLLIIHKSELFCLSCVASRPPDIAGMECWWQEEGGGRLVMKYYPTAPAISTPSLSTQINNKF